MIRLSLAEKVRRADDRGMSPARIAAAYNIPPKYVYRILWERDNKEYRRAWDAARKREQYHSNPKYRAKKIKAAQASRDRGRYNLSM